MANILDYRQLKIDSGECRAIYNSKMRRADGENGHCLLCSAAIGGGRGLKTAYAGGGALLCAKCFEEYGPALALKEEKTE